MKIVVLPKFTRQYKKLSKELKKIAKKKEKIFRHDPFDSRLRTHKLSGKLSGYWAYSVSHSYRIIFDFKFENDKKVARFYYIGTHQIYD